MEFNAKTFVVAVVAFVVAIVLVTTVLVPIISQSTSENITKVNSGTKYALVSTENDLTHTIGVSVTGTAAPVFTLDGNTIKLPDKKANAPIIFGDDWMIVVNGNAVEYVVGNGSDNKTLTPDTGDYSISMTIAVPTGTFTATEYGASAFTDDNTVAYLNPENGNYVLSRSPSVLEDNTIYLAYYGTAESTGDSNVTIGYLGTGNISTIASSVTAISPMSVPAHTVSGTTATMNTPTTESPLKQIKDITMVTTLDDSSTVTIKDPYVLAPVSVTYANPNYEDNGAINSILNIIPLLIVVGIVLGAVSMINIVRKN